MSSRRPRMVIAGAVSCLLALGTAAAVGTGLTRAKLRSAELTGDGRFETMLNDDPASLLGGTRAVYLPGYGMVFSAELDLAPRLTPNPFRPSFTKQDIAHIREVKKQ